MQIINCGTGVHQREVRGIERLRTLPSHWYAFTNLDLAMGVGKSRELDVIIVADDRIFVVDLKDWNGQIESENTRWKHNGRDTGPSPVQKVGQNVREIAIQLGGYLKRHGKGLSTPLVLGLVVITGNADIKGVAPTEVSNVLHVEPFIRAAQTPGRRTQVFGQAFREFTTNPLTSSTWKKHLNSFFNTRTGPMKPGRRRYGNFVANSDDATFTHPGGVFSEYDAEDENSSKTLGMLRVWDFSKTDGRFQTEEGRHEIAGRERDVISFLTDRGERFENAFLDFKVYDPERSVGYWEVFDRRRRLKRLSEFVATERDHLSRDGRYELVRQIVSRVADLHSVDAAHLDLGAHSVWLEAPSTTRLSHLMSARFPQVESLGENRYRFLSALRVPEDVLGGGDDSKRKDVFLLGVVAHHLVFGKTPAAGEDSADIPEWVPSVDADLAHAELHGWFERALSLEPSNRFPDAASALLAFNAMTTSRPTALEVAEGLEGFRTDPKSQRLLFSAYPATAMVREGERLEAWISGVGEDRTFVKLWKRAAWGDQEREAPRILSFLERASELVRSPPTGCARLLRACWLGDAFCIVQEYVDGSDLAASLTGDAAQWRRSEAAMPFLRQLAETVIDLHARGIAHGDLKPSNVIVTGEELTPVLVDLIDFSSAADGEIATSAYSPQAGGRMERDRYAVGKIAEEVLAHVDIQSEVSAELAKAIKHCRDAEPGNATLLPLTEALERAISPAPVEKALQLVLSIKDAQIGEILADEGRFFVRSKDDYTFFIRGAAEEIQVWIDKEDRPYRARRQPIDQARIGRVSRFEFMSIPATLAVTSATVNDFSGLAPLLADPAFQANLEGAPPSDETETVAEDAAGPLDGITGDDAEDRLADEITAEVIADAERSRIVHLGLPAIELPRLWRHLIDVESEQTTEGDATAPSSFRRDASRHVVPFELAHGTFEFKRDDKVAVERLDSKGHWRRIGQLDIGRSRPDQILIDASDTYIKGQRDLVHAEQRLRFTSHMVVQSLKRRESAVSMMLSRQSRTPNLIDFFDPRVVTSPSRVAHEVDRSALAAYSLNAVQDEALIGLLTMRPLGLVQGPPGTGKTRFIAALAHYALTKGLARNVLLASQSHEAVNNAAEAVVKLFASGDEQPSILRVGNETVVSERLMPFHTDRVETLFKDRFAAELTERLAVAGRALGLPDSLTEAISVVETELRPVIDRIEELAGEGDQEGRVNSLRETLEAQLARIDLRASDIDDWPETPVTVEAVVTELLSRTWEGTRVAPDRVGRLRAVARLGRDFLTSVSTAQRGFETFLAGTRQIVAGTCVGLGRPSLGLTTTPFDLVIVDEAARCTASELAVPMQAGRWVVLVGDQAQLEPHHPPEVVERVAAMTGIPRREIVRSDFERAFQTDYGRSCGRTLLTQYRMLPPIGRIVSDTFYGGRLESGRTDPVIEPSVLPETLAKPVLWVSTDGMGERAFERHEQSGNSIHNPAEADAIVSLLKRWHGHDPFREWVVEHPAQAIGVICMYADQRNLIRRRLLSANISEAFRKQVKVDTVDSYQGKENPVVVVSLVRNNDTGRTHQGAATIHAGFLARANRINVAASRAMDRLVIVGAKNRWLPASPMAQLAAAFGRELDAGNAEILPADSLRDTGSARSSRARADGSRLEAQA